MNNATNTLNKVKAVLGLEVKMEQLKLENGTLLEADKFESGESIFIVTDDEKVALPVGEYELEDNRTLVVKEEGVIANFADTTEEEVVEDEEIVDEEELKYVSKEEFSLAVEEIKQMIDEIKAGYGDKEEDEKEEMSQEEEEANELKEELSKPATQPLKHSPEKTSTKKEMVRFASKRQKSILDTVFQKFNN